MPHAQILALPLLASAGLTLLACGGTKAAPQAAGAPAPAAAAAPASGEFPSDAASRAFMSALTMMEIKNFAAVDSTEGAKVVFSTLRFQGDNTWSAQGYVDAGEERMECTEKGTWTMEPASSPKEATVTWVIDQTDCIGRENGASTRALFTLTADDVDVAFR